MCGKLWSVRPMMLRGNETPAGSEWGEVAPLISSTTNRALVMEATFRQNVALQPEKYIQLDCYSRV